MVFWRIKKKEGWVLVPLKRLTKHFFSNGSGDSQNSRDALWSKVVKAFHGRDGGFGQNREDSRMKRGRGLKLLAL